MSIVLNMIEYNRKKENDYWDNYYKSKTEMFPNSDFSKFVLKHLKKQSTLIDIGCGDGRDSFFFSNNEIMTKGVDFSIETIKKNLLLSNRYLSFEHLDLININSLKQSFDYAYCRFILHSITESVENTLLKWLKSSINNSIFFETRILDKSKNTKNLNHYRRFFTENEFIDKLSTFGFDINYLETSYKFSKYKELYNVKDLDFDPLVLRVIIQQNPNVELHT